MLRPRSGTLVVPLTTSQCIAESRQQVAGRYEGGIARGHRAISIDAYATVSNSFLGPGSEPQGPS